MRRKLSKALTRAARGGVLLTTLGLGIAIAIGVGGFLASAEPASAVAAQPPAPRFADELPGMAMTYAARATAVGADNSGHAAAVGEQAFETTRIAEATDGADDTVRAARLAAGGTPALAPGDRIRVSVSFYYCESGDRTPARGDGGGFCGAMRDGSVVYNGAAACDVIYLGQRFRIEGDPLARIYKCADTGSAVHGLHRDIWFSSSDDGWSWQRSVGQAATIEVLR